MGKKSRNAGIKKSKTSEEGYVLTTGGYLTLPLHVQLSYHQSRMMAPNINGKELSYHQDQIDWISKLPTNVKLLHEAACTRAKGHNPFWKPSHVDYATKDDELPCCGNHVWGYQNPDSYSFGDCIQCSTSQRMWSVNWCV